MVNSDTIAFEAELSSIKTLSGGDELALQLKVPKVYREKVSQLLAFVGCYGAWAVTDFVDASKPAK